MSFSFMYLGKRPEDFNEYAKVFTHEIGYPKKVKLLRDVPFSNVEYDFSTIYGEQTYENRLVKYTINIVHKGSIENIGMHSVANQIIDWVLSSDTMKPLFDEQDPDYHFLGEVRDEPALADSFKFGKLSVTFNCYPYRIKNLPEGNDVWDSFNFETDIAQNVKYDVQETRTINLINLSDHAVNYKVTTTGDVTYEGPDMMEKGDNKFVFTGTGTAEVTWYREVI